MALLATPVLAQSVSNVHQTGTNGAATVTQTGSQGQNDSDVQQAGTGNKARHKFIVDRTWYKEARATFTGVTIMHYGGPQTAVHRHIQISHPFGAAWLAPAKIVRKPTSHSSVSHPNP